MFLDKEIKSTDHIIIYPNPASDFLTINAKSKVEKISILDISGKKINVKLEGDKIDVRSLPSGVYIIGIKTSKGRSIQKFIKK